MKKIGIALSLACALVADTLQVESGWNLLSVSVPSTTADCLLKQLPDGAKIYKFDNMKKRWIAKSNNPRLNAFFAHHGYDDLSTITSTDGFWFYNPAEPTTINQTCDTTTNVTTTALTDEQKYTLAYMWNEEKMAKDIYLALYELYSNEKQSRVLYNIATKSETRHQAAIEKLLKKYDINILDSDYASGYSPTALKAFVRGEYSIPQIQELYNRLYAKGSQSFKDALEVGCMVEVTDVEDLDKDIVLNRGHDDIVSVFDSLRNGSYKHYWAFDKALKAIGVENGCCSLGEKYCKTPKEFPADSSHGNGANGKRSSNNGGSRY